METRYIVLMQGYKMSTTTEFNIAYLISLYQIVTCLHI
jgi:hypothetical protein